MVSISPVPAHFTPKDAAYVVSANGYIIWDFMRVETKGDQQHIDFKGKRTFVMTARNCDTLLGLDLHGRKPDPKDEGEIAFYKGKDDVTTRILKITRPNEDFRLSYMELNGEQIEQEAHIPLKLGQLRAA